MRPSASMALRVGLRVGLKVGQAPSWGDVAGIDLQDAEVVWKHRNGTTRDSMPFGLPIGLNVGVPALGGPLTTAGGVSFLSGTLDQYLRGYDITTHVLASFGGAGGQHACSIARALGMRRVRVHRVRLPERHALQRGPPRRRVVPLLGARV